VLKLTLTDERGLTPGSLSDTQKNVFRFQKICHSSALKLATFLGRDGSRWEIIDFFLRFHLEKLSTGIGLQAFRRNRHFGGLWRLSLDVSSIQFDW